MIFHIIKGLLWLFFMIALALILSDCTKPVEPTPTCKRVYFLSDKYRLKDTVYIKTDTLWPWGSNNVFCGSDTLQFLVTEELRLCSMDMYEVRRFVIGDKKTTHKVF